MPQADLSANGVLAVCEKYVWGETANMFGQKRTTGNTVFPLWWNIFTSSTPNTPWRQRSPSTPWRQLKHCFLICTIHVLCLLVFVLSSVCKSLCEFSLWDVLYILYVLYIKFTLLCHEDSSHLLLHEDSSPATLWRQQWRRLSLDTPWWQPSHRFLFYTIYVLILLVFVLSSACKALCEFFLWEMLYIWCL